MNNFDTINPREKFLKLSLDNYFASINQLVKTYLASQPTDLSYSGAFDSRSDIIPLFETIPIILSLIGELRQYNSGEADGYLKKLDLFNLYLNSINDFNDLLVQIDVLLESNKKILSEISLIYKLFVKLLVADQKEFVESLYQRFSSYLSSFELTEYLVERSEFDEDLICIISALLEVRFGRPEEINNISMESVSDLFYKVEGISYSLSLKTRYLLHKLLKLAIGKMIDYSDSNPVQLSEYYVHLLTNMRSEESLIFLRNVVQKGILRLESNLDEDKIFQLEYEFYKKLEIDLIHVIDIDDKEYLSNIKTSIVDLLNIAKSKYVEEGSLSKRNRRRIDYIQKILNLLHEI